MINPNHPQVKNLSNDEKETINNLHEIRESIIKAAACDVYVAKRIYKLWIENEYTLQRLWGFEENANMHRFWEYPYCTCPKLDNEDRYGTSSYIVSRDCPIHGGML